MVQNVQCVYNRKYKSLFINFSHKIKYFLKSLYLKIKIPMCGSYPQTIGYQISILVWGGGVILSLIPFRWVQGTNSIQNLEFSCPGGPFISTLLTSESHLTTHQEQNCLQSSIDIFQPYLHKLPNTIYKIGITTKFHTLVSNLRRNIHLRW